MPLNITVKSQEMAHWVYRTPVAKCDLVTHSKMWVVSVFLIMLKWCVVMNSSEDNTTFHFICYYYWIRIALIWHFWHFWEALHLEGVKFGKFELDLQGKLYMPCK